VGCAAQPKGPVYEPVRFEDGTPVTEDAEAEALFGQDTFLADTAFTDKGDTLLTFRHASAFIRLQLDGLPEGIDKISLIPMKGEITALPVTTSESGNFILWMAKKPGGLPAAAALAQGADGRLWSARLPALDLQPGIAYRWTETFVPPEAPTPGLTAKPLSQTALPGIEAGEYSGITWLADNRYAVVDDNLKGGGILLFTIPLDNYGSVGDVSMRPVAGTVQATGRLRDNEGVAFVPSLGTLYVSSESHQEILEYDLGGNETGKSLRVPADLAVKTISDNRGFEALTYNDITGLFWTTTEAPLKKDTFLPNILRLQSFDKDGKPAERYLYQADEPLKSAANTVAYVFGIPAMAALDDGRLLVLEREVYVPKGSIWDKLQKSFTALNLYLVDPVHDTAGILRKSLLCSFTTSALDLANYEGMCLGPTLPDGARCLVLIADSENGSGGLTQEYVKVILLR
jgi:hypothetical protein